LPSTLRFFDALNDHFVRYFMSAHVHDKGAVPTKDWLAGTARLNNLCG
jgi:hypothetical protein